MVWEAVVMLVVSTVVSAMLAPKPKDAEPSSLGEFQVPTAEEGRPIPILLGTCKLKAPNVTWWGALRTEAIKRISNAMTGSRTTIGYRYHLGMQQALALGPIDELVDILVGDKSLKDAGASITTSYSAGGATLNINLPELFGGDEKEGGLVGTLAFYFGSATQGADAYLATQFGTAAPAWRGVCFAVLKDFYIGTSNYPKDWSWVLRCCPCPAGFDTTKRNINGDCNPAYGLAYLLTQPRELGGCGEALGTLDTATFQAAATTLYAEGFGLSLLLDQARSADTWMGEILRHIDGVLYTDPASGLTCLKLLRADYDPATIPEFIEADLQEAPEVTIAAPPDTLNRVVVRYVDRSQGYTVRTAQDQDAGNYWARGEGADITMDFLGASNPTLAQYIAAREMKGMASPLAKGTLHLNRKAWALRPGSPFKLTFAPQGWSGLACRVTNIRYGTIGSGKITVEFAQDVFSVGAQAYNPPPSGGWTDPVTTPQPCLAQALLEAPYWLVGQARYVLAAGARADQITVGADIWTDEGSGYLQTGLLGNMTPYGLLTAAYSCKTAALDATGFTVGNGVDLAGLVGVSTNADGRNRGVNLAWFEATNEMVSWTTCTDNGNGTYTFSNTLRGVMDTVPSDQALGGKVWFLTGGSATTRSGESGDKGEPGTTGDQGIQGNPGRGYIWHGAWDSAHAYVVDDTCFFNGSTYVSILAGTNHAPDVSPTYWDLMAQKGTDGTGGGSGVPTDWISGMSLTWVSTSAVTLEKGSCWVPGSASVLNVTTPIAKTGLTGLTANTWYHVYAYDNGGTPDIEITTTGPATPYMGTACTKNGNTSRRYVGSIWVNATPAIGAFYQVIDGNVIEQDCAYRTTSGDTSDQATVSYTSVPILTGLPIKYALVTATHYPCQGEFINLKIGQDLDSSGNAVSLPIIYYANLVGSPNYSGSVLFMYNTRLYISPGNANFRWWRRTWNGTIRGMYLDINKVGYSR